MAEPNVERFWDRVQRGQPDECWLWLGSRLPAGYGRFARSYAHRMAWSLANGSDVPPGLVVMHSCDNPPCCNPAHLSVGTYRDNAEDRDRKGRHRPPIRRGELAPHLRTITDEQVVQIRALREQGLTHRRIAAVIGIAPSSVYHYTTGPRADYEVAA